MPDNSIINAADCRIKEAVCIDTKRIYDSCVSKDCLENLRAVFSEADQATIDAAQTIKCKTCEVSAVAIDVEEVPFNRGYYSCDITYYFTLGFDTYSAPCTAAEQVSGYASFTKKCILYGSDGDVKVFTSTPTADETECPISPQYTNPSCKVQTVDPIVLDTNVANIYNGSVNTNFPSIIFPNDTVPQLADNAQKAVLVTLGLFSIIQMERDVQLLIPAYDYCIPERECRCDNQSPCEAFRCIDFPVEEFFPVERENPSCCDNTDN
jgi:hypothetical protein